MVPFTRTTLLLLVSILFLMGSAASQAVPADGEDDVIRLSMEVTALQVIHDLRLTPSQLDDLAKMVKSGTSQKMPDRKAPKVSDKMRKGYVDLRQAFIDADDDKINDIMAELDELRDVEKIELDDEFDLTDAARKKAGDLLNKLTPRQIAIYISEFADEFPDPAEKISEAFEESRSLRGKEWIDLRDQVAGQVGWLVGGLDAKAEDKVREAVSVLLDRASKMKDDEYKKNKKDLEKRSKVITDAVAPPDVLKHFLLRTLAELLSNPRTAAALEAKMKAK